MLIFDSFLGRPGTLGDPRLGISALQETKRKTHATMGYMVCRNLPCVPISPTPPRFFDVSKQVVGQLFVHGLNLLISDAVSQHTSGNACVFYFLNILFDTTFGQSLHFLY